jgi:enoyl-CoA hydratase/carnithine racemase
VTDLESPPAPVDYGIDCPNFTLTRSGGILQLTLHSAGESFVFNRSAQHEFGELFHRIRRDTENRVLIVAGTGADFCASFDNEAVAELLTRDPSAGWHIMRADATAMLEEFVALDLPVISVVNGPARCHSELPLVADVVLASTTAVFQDATHMLGGMPPADGVQLVWNNLLGLNRGRYHLLTGAEISAEQALAWGMVAELHEPGGLLPRAWELAAKWAKWPRHLLSMWRATYMSELRRHVAEQLYQGLSYEGLAVVQSMSRPVRAHA